MVTLLKLRNLIFCGFKNLKKIRFAAAAAQMLFLFSFPDCDSFGVFKMKLNLTYKGEF